MATAQNPETNARLSEVVATLSMATDLAMGQPLEYALSTCQLAVRLGESLKLGADELREVYYLSLLRHIGCNAETYRMAEVVGDELAFRTDIAPIDMAQTSKVMGLLLRYIRQASVGTSPLRLAGIIAQDMATMPGLMKEEFAGFCEVGQRLAERLGFSGSLIQSLGQVFERWDGKGLPARLKGENISFTVQIVTLAGDMVVLTRLEGAEAARNIIQARNGTVYHPKIVEHFATHAPELMAGMETEPAWDSVIALEPTPCIILSETLLDEACQVIADFTDLKSPYTIGHSSGVAQLAAEAGHCFGLPETDITNLRRAALLHDVGRVGISAGIWGKQGPLTESDWEKVRLHPYYTNRILARSAALAKLGEIAALHHERLDSSGYHRGLVGQMLPVQAKLLAAADIFQAMTEPRPHRPAMSPEQAAETLRTEVKAGRIDSASCQAVLEAAGLPIQKTRPRNLAGLSEREVEVLRLIARGNSTAEIANALTISRKTTDHHIQHIYTKVGISTRAAATLFALQNGLLER